MKNGWVYIVGAQETGLVKIGYTSNPPRRFVALRTACPVEMFVLYLVAGDASDEKALHRQFKSLRVRKEWFRLEPGNELDTFIHKAREDWEMVLHADDFNEDGFWYGKAQDSEEGEEDAA